MRDNCRPLKSLTARPDPRISWWRVLAAWPAAMLVRLWLMSLRIDISPASLKVVTAHGRPLIFAIWHNRLLLSPEMMRRYRRRPLYALISMSDDGGMLTAVFSALNMSAVRGSSSRGGREAATDAIDLLGHGHDLGMTPDGPRGPVYRMKPGAVVMARRAGAGLILVGVELTSAWRVRSWDGFHLPKPFSRVLFTFEQANLPEDEEVEAAAQRLGLRLKQLNVDHQPAPVRNRAKA